MTDELEAIRARYEADPYDRSQAVADRATLLRLLDAAREELREVKETAVISIPTDLAKLVINIGVAEWGSTHAETADGHADHVRESVRKTAEHFGQTEPQQMHGLYIAGTETVICHTGTSPNSPQIARALTGAWNNLVELSAAALKAPPTRAQGESS
jgi:uncharacterized protein YfaS (alpha-2-macroglobulin family)